MAPLPPGPNPIPSNARANPSRGGRWAAIRWAGIGLIACVSGCQTGPKKFSSINDPSPVMRARAIGLGENQPDNVAVPALLSRLSDPDPVVRLAAGEALKRRSGQDFGYQPYADPTEQSEAIGKWQGWWQARQAGAGKVPTQMTTRKARRRGIFR